MQLPIRRLRIDPRTDTDRMLEQEWLVTNGMGGYASGTVLNIPTRRYHGLLIAALPAPLGRTMMLNDLAEEIILSDDRTLRLGGTVPPSTTLEFAAQECFRGFRLEGGLPTWTFEWEDVVLEKRIFMSHLQNTVHLHYRLLRGADSLRLTLRPALQIRGHDDPVDQSSPEPWAVQVINDRYLLAAPEGSPFPDLRFVLQGGTHTLTLEPWHSERILYQAEQRRGYGAIGQLWSPGYFHATLVPDQSLTFMASTESWETVLAISPAEALNSTRERLTHLLQAATPTNAEPVAYGLVLAADQFIITPVGRAEERARARAAGDEVRTVIAGYHWFTDWGRDTMISLEGLTLATGRLAEAGSILRTFGHYVRDGLIPNLFPEGQREGLYHTADATLWFFHALDRYLEYTRDRTTLRLLLPTLIQIYQAHLDGTHFGIGVDPADGLLRQGAEGYQLTWMDAKVENWVVTPRRGKAVEINALWYNALRLLEEWLNQASILPLAGQVSQLAARAHHSFNTKFWNSEQLGLFDVIEGPTGNDPACRPNQILSFSLQHPVLDPERWKSVLSVVQQKLLTPVGLRSLAAGHPDYKAQYFGDLRARDAAYHQGTIWAWLIGPFIDAWMRVHPDKPETARKFLDGFDAHLNEACVGSISEIFDAEAPYHPRGCIAQAWSVAEVLRAYVKTRAKPAAS